MKSADLRALDEQLRLASDPVTALAPLLLEHLKKDQVRRVIDSAGSNRYYVLDRVRVLCDGLDFDYDPSAPRRQAATLLSVAGVWHDELAAILGSPLEHPDFSDEPAAQVLALLHLLETTQMLDEDSPLPQGSRRAALARMHELLLEFPVLMHPDFLWDSKRKSAGSMSVLEPLLHCCVNRASAALPILSDAYPEARLRVWATHPAVTAAVLAKSPEFAVRTNNSNAGKTAMASSLTLFTRELVGMLRLSRLRRPPAGSGQQEAPGAQEAPDGAQDAAGAGIEPSGQVLWDIGREFAALWRHDTEGAPGSDLDTARRESQAAFRQELAAASEAIKAAVVSSMRAHIDCLFAEANAPEAAINPDVRLRNLVSELVACGLAPSLPAAAALAGRSLLAPGFPDDVGRKLAKVDATHAQKLMKTLVDFGAPVEELKAALDSSLVDANVLKPFVQACDALAAAQSMTAIIGAAQPASDAGTAPGARRRSAL